MKNTKEELDAKITELRQSFDPVLQPSMKRMQEWFGSKYNDVFYESRKCWINLTIFFNGSNGKSWRKKFNNCPIQPVTVTYRRCDLVFFKFDNFPQYGEEYFVHNVSTNWTKNFYPREIKASELFKNKMYLIEENPRELYLQVNVVQIDNLNGIIQYENDIDFSNLI